MLEYFLPDKFHQVNMIESLEIVDLLLECRQSLFVLDEGSRTEDPFALPNEQP